MDNIITELYIKISHMTKELESTIKTDKKNTNEGNILSLVALLKKELSTFDKDEWETALPKDISLQDLYNMYSEFFDTDYGKLSFFLVLSQNKATITKYNPAYICLIVDSMVKTRINPYNFGLYLSIFLTDTISNQLSYIELEVTELFMMNLIQKTPIEEVRRKNIPSIHRRLCDLIGIEYSPVFGGNFLLPDVYRIIKRMMHAIDKMVPTFTEHDYEMLKYLIETYNTRDIPKLKAMSNAVAEIEKENQDNPTGLIKSLLKYLDKEKAAAQGISIIIRSEN